MFLIKQGHHSVVCELNLRGFDYELNVISGRIANIEMMNRVIAEVGPEPAVVAPLSRGDSEGRGAVRRDMKSGEKRVAVV